MLKSLVICTTTCLAYKYPLERSVALFLLLISNYNIRGICYYSIILDHLNCNLILLSYFIIILCILTNNKFRYIKKYLFCNSSLLFFLILSFLSNNLLNFFILFESSLIPLFFLILG